MKREEFTHVLRELMPDAYLSPEAGLQERRSAETRLTILDAAIECLAEVGYARFTTALVAERARASRGAMLHHYPSKKALVEATIDYAFFKRMDRYIADIERMSEAERVDDNLGVQAHWQGYLTPEYQAYLELNVAARTDAELRKIFVPRAKEFDRIWRDEVLKVFPEWAEDLWRFEFGTYFAKALHEGMALNRDVWEGTGIEEILLAFTSQTETMIRRGELKIPPRPVEPEENG